MKRKMFYGLSTAAMLMVAPTASAGYWTGHADVIKTLIENWVLNHSLAPKGSQLERSVKPDVRDSAAARTAAPIRSGDARR